MCHGMTCVATMNFNIGWDEMDSQKIEKLYVLLERAVREYDTEAAAALRWAIFYLENYPQA